jgi:hypothetical protein
LIGFNGFVAKSDLNQILEIICQIQILKPFYLLAQTNDEYKKMVTSLAKSDLIEVWRLLADELRTFSDG